jgi:hypothetical protein
MYITSKCQYPNTVFTSAQPDQHIHVTQHRSTLQFVTLGHGPFEEHGSRTAIKAYEGVQLTAELTVPNVQTGTAVGHMPSTADLPASLAFNTSCRKRSETTRLTYHGSIRRNRTQSEDAQIMLYKANQRQHQLKIFKCAY